MVAGVTSQKKKLFGLIACSEHRTLLSNSIPSRSGECRKPRCSARVGRLKVALHLVSRTPSAVPMLSEGMRSWSNQREECRQRCSGVQPSTLRAYSLTEAACCSLSLVLYLVLHAGDDAPGGTSTSNSALVLQSTAYSAPRPRAPMAVRPSSACAPSFHHGPPPATHLSRLQSGLPHFPNLHCCSRGQRDQVALLQAMMKAQVSSQPAPRQPLDTTFAQCGGLVIFPHLWHRSLSLFAFLPFATLMPLDLSDPLCEHLHLSPRAQAPLA